MVWLCDSSACRCSPSQPWEHHQLPEPPQASLEVWPMTDDQDSCEDGQCSQRLYSHTPFSTGGLNWWLHLLLLLQVSSQWPGVPQSCRQWWGDQTDQPHSDHGWDHPATTQPLLILHLQHELDHQRTRHVPSIGQFPLPSQLDNPQPVLCEILDLWCFPPKAYAHAGHHKQIDSSTHTSSAWSWRDRLVSSRGSPHQNHSPSPGPVSIGQCMLHILAKLTMPLFAKLSTSMDVRLLRAGHVSVELETLFQQRWGAHHGSPSLHQPGIVWHLVTDLLWSLASVTTVCIRGSWEPHLVPLLSTSSRSACGPQLVRSPSPPEVQTSLNCSTSSSRCTRKLCLCQHRPPRSRAPSAWEISLQPSAGWTPWSASWHWKSFFSSLGPSTVRRTLCFHLLILNFPCIVKHPSSLHPL